MTPFLRMQLRMLLPCLLPLPAGLTLAWLVAWAEGVPLYLDLRVMPAIAPQLIFFGSLLVAALCLGFQTWRLWRWMKAGGERCDGCGRLSGARDEGRIGRRGRPGRARKSCVE